MERNSNNSREKNSNFFWQESPNVWNTQTLSSEARLEAAQQSERNIWGGPESIGGGVGGYRALPHPMDSGEAGRWGHPSRLKTSPGQKR